MTAILEMTGVGKRYRRTWALRDCTLSVPKGRVVGLVGPNGAGKTTLLDLAVGMLRPTTGDVRVFGHMPRTGYVRARLGYVAQDKPLYRSFTVAETLKLGRHLNPGWDQEYAEQRLNRLGIPMGKRVGHLSGGQRAQVALAMALGRRPELLLLDEPVVDLDPLARQEFMRALMSEVEASGLGVILSSHVVSELDQMCDHLILLSASRVQLSGDIETLLESHRLLQGPRENGTKAGPHTVISASRTDRQSTLLVRLNGPLLDPAWQARPVGLEQLVLAYMSQDADPGRHLVLAEGGTP
ncbi:ABC transporter ATP-binding protein [Actinomadura nitritigenes]|uniref:ABC transporter ATP-binding protein n=1 Tax=Actinomadura nitritigenes TaxID=134602 RepID=UPI003D91E448